MIPLRAQLIPLDGGPGLAVVKDLTLVGRQEECDLCLHHKSVSKMHCVLVKTDGLLLLRDLGSTNGTRVNGQRVRRAALLPNDELSIAGFKFRVDFGPAEPSVDNQEHTQQLNAAEVAKLAQKPGRGTPIDDSGHLPAPPIQPNALPDVYVEKDAGKK